MFLETGSPGTSPAGVQTSAPSRVAFRTQEARASVTSTLSLPSAGAGRPVSVLQKLNRWISRVAPGSTAMR